MEQESRSVSIDTFVYEVFRRAGVPTNLSGYRYIRKLVEKYKEYRETGATSRFYISREYGNVADCGRTGRTVERTVTTCAKKLYKNKEEWKRIFGTENWKSNADFITGLYEYYRHNVQKG